MKRIVLATGGLDLIYSGHILYLNAAKKLDDSLIVGLNRNDWLRRKKRARIYSLGRTRNYYCSFS